MGNGTRTITVKFSGNTSGLTRSAVEAYAALKKVGQDTSGLKKAQGDAEALSRQLDATAKEAKDKGSLMGGALALGLSAAAPVVGAALVGGVALGFIGMAALVQKNNAQVQASFGALKNQVVTEMRGASDQVVPYLVKSGHSLQQEFANLGPQLDTAFRFAGPDITILTQGVDNLATNAMPGFVNSMRNSKPIVQGISVVLGDLGTTATTVLNAVSSHSAEFGRDLDQVGGLVQNLGSVAGSVLPGLASGFGTTVGSLNGLLGLLKPVAPAIGDITGELLPAVGAFKLFGLATGPLNSLGSKVTSAGAKLGIFSAQLTNSASVGEKVTKTTSKLGSALGTMGKALPIAGVGFALLGDAMSAAESQQQAVLQGLLAGGQASQDATNKIVAAAPAIAHLGAGFKQGEGSAAQFTNALNVATKGLDPLQRATAIYNADLKQFGVNAPQTVAAGKALAKQTDALADSNQRLAKVQQDVNAQLLNEQTALLGSISASLTAQSDTLAVADAQKNYAAAVKQSGAGSTAAKQALIQLEQAQQAEIQATEDAAAAAHTGATASQLARIKTDALASSALGLAGASKGQLTPALKQTVAGLTATQIAAFTSTGKVAGLHQEIVHLPNGKTIKINVDSNGNAVTRATQDEINHMHGVALSIKAVDHVTSTVNQIIRTNSGKVIHVEVGPGGNSIQLGHRATGGPVTAGMPYIVGERGRELFVPGQSGRIVPNSVVAEAGPWGGDLYLTLDLGAGITQRMRVENRDLRRGVKAGSKIR